MSARSTIDDDDDDGLFDEEDSSDEEEKVKPTKRKASDLEKPSKKAKPSQNSWIDDAAEESGEEGGDDDEDDDDDEDENDYVKDGFVVDDDKVEMAERKKRTGDLEDSDDDENDDDDDDDDDDDNDGKKKKARKIRKFRQHEELADEDLDIIREAQGVDLEKERMRKERLERENRKVVARTEEDLRKGLFRESDGEDDDDAIAQPERKVRSNIEHYDEHGMDDFIDDDIGDQHDILASDRGKYVGEDGEGVVSQAQMNEASEIFGTDYLNYMATEDDYDEDDDDDLFGKNRYRERGVGIDAGIDSDDDMSDDDLFGDDDDDEAQTQQQKEALKLKREKRELARKERRKNILAKKIAKQKAHLRKQFEPVQLVENFCTDRDDEIRQKDAPERYFDWNVPFHGSKEGGDLTEDEEEEVMWIMQRIPEIQAEYKAPYDNMEELEQRESSILQSIAHALRFMHVDKMEPAFIKRYRKDIVTSPSVRNNLYRIMDEDAEWDELLQARAKVSALLNSVTAKFEKIEETGAKSAQMGRIDEDLTKAQASLDKTAIEEAQLKQEIDQIGSIVKTDDDNDDDELFGDDQDDEVSRDEAI